MLVRKLGKYYNNKPIGKSGYSEALVSIAGPETNPLSPLLQKQITKYENFIGITERPDVRALGAPTEVCTRVQELLGYSLYSCMLQGGVNVRVRCNLTTPDRLLLEVVWDRIAQTDVRHEEMTRFVLSHLHRDAERIGGRIAFGGLGPGPSRPPTEVVIQLFLPITP